MNWLSNLSTKNLNISDHDQLDSAKKALLIGTDELFEDRAGFYLGMSGQTSFMDSFASAMEKFLSGQIDMIIASVTALTSDDIEALEKLILSPNKPFSVRSSTFGRIIIDNGCLEF